MKLNAKQRLEAWRTDVRMAVKPSSLEDILEYSAEDALLPNTKSYKPIDVFGPLVKYTQIGCQHEFTEDFNRINKGQPFRLVTPAGTLFIDPQGGGHIRFAAVIE